ncbi:ribonuclease H [Senna tora]|uniref:Ribonuclease H n=1 Tax=Senna tora TaxID=362788 RepID=A0A834T5R3_9FABA|nr:ribonuclease H [Senna tora]
MFSTSSLPSYPPNDVVDPSPLLTHSLSDHLLRRPTPPLRSAARYFRRASGRRMMLREPSLRVRENAAEQLEARQSQWAFSKTVVILDVVWHMAFVVVGVVVLGMSMEEKPTAPLRAWVCCYLIEGVFHCACVIVKYRRRVEARAASASMEQQDEDAAWPSGGSDVEESGVGRLQETHGCRKRMESLNTMLAFIWWLLGFYWWIHAHITLPNQQQFLFIGVYGPSVLNERNSLWDFLNNVRPGNSPWIVIGDFNQIINNREKLSKNQKIRGSSRLVDSINSLGLIDLPTTGNWFTWTNGRQGDDLVWERIDKTFSNTNWLHLFPETWVEVLPVAASGHSPLVIHVQRAHPSKQYSFKFELMWLQHPQFQEIIRSNWLPTNSGSRAMQVNSKLNSITKKIAQWNKHEFDPALIKEAAKKYFMDLYSSNSSMSPDQRKIIVSNSGIPILTEDHIQHLTKPFTKFEIETALFQMKGSKAPSPDGMPPIFFQQFWDTVGTDITGMVASFLTRGHLLRTFNRTNVVLIPKKDNPASLKDYRPISLCNTSYKIIAKTLTNRLQPIMKDIILPFQNAFVKDRSIHDNIILAKELLHYINGGKNRKQVWAALKVDLHKAYDKVTWLFLEEVLTHMNFPPLWRRIIMECVTTSTLRIRINGDYSDWFHPKAGLRQGDPLSPYLFVLCTNVLSSYLVQAEHLKHIQGPKISRQAHPLNHLMYADDLLIFFKANQETCANVDLLLNIFGQASGLLMNKEKSEMKFSPNTSENQKNLFLSIINCKGQDYFDKYLGAFIDGPNQDRQNAELILDHLQQKLTGWKASMLSQAARFTLIQAVLSAIPLYTLHFTSLTDNYARKCNSLMNNFFWGNWGDGKTTPLIAWDKICRSKAEGGLGLRSIQSLNKALLEKQLCRIITSNQGLMSTIMRAKYVDPFPNGNLKCRPYDSPLWKKLYKCKHLVMDHLRWRVGDGTTISLYDHYWVPPDYHTHPFTKVSQLMSGGFWDSAKLRRVYLPQKIKTISKINISFTNQKDILIWGNSTSGKYDLKEAYHISRPEQSGSPLRNCEWQGIWKLKFPYKIIMFWWRTLHNGLPLRQNLARRGFRIEDSCPFGCDESETESHLFKNCPFAKLVWFESKLMIRTESINQNSIIDWIDFWIQDQDTNNAHIRNSLIPEAITICWSIYTQRNQVLFQDGKRDHNEVLNRVSHVMKNIQHAFELPTLDPFFALDRPHHRPTPYHPRNIANSSSITIFCSWRKDALRLTKSVILYTYHNSHIYPLIMLVVNMKNNMLTSVVQCLRTWMLMPHGSHFKAVICIPNRNLISQLHQRSLAPLTYSIIIDDIVAINSPYGNFTFTFLPQEGASKEEINQLPKYRFQRVEGDVQDSSSKGIMTECDSDTPAQHLISMEDASSENFLATTIFTYTALLHINATCPLCKFNLLNANHPPQQEV